MRETHLLYRHLDFGLQTNKIHFHYFVFVSFEKLVFYPLEQNGTTLGMMV